eukprot:1325979-Karenia_brevis.AAC.1
MQRMQMEMYQKELGMKIERKKESSQQTQEGTSGDRVIYIETRSKVPRSLKNIRGDVDKHAPTTGSPGCIALRRGLAYQPNSPACGRRFQETSENEAT